MSREEIEKAKEHYRQLYYGDSDAQLSMHCGWSSNDAQLSAYGAFLDLFDKSGDVLDLGCGNGALLAFLVSNSPASLRPYGVDFLEESIREAKDVVLPGFAANFSTSSVDDFNPDAKRFRYVITSPDYTFETDSENYVRKCFGWVEPIGKLVLYDYKGSEYFQDFAVAWSNLKLGPVSIVKTKLSVIVCYARNV